MTIILKGHNCNCKLAYKLLFLLLVATAYLTYLALSSTVTQSVRVDEKMKETKILEELSEQLQRNLTAVQTHLCSNAMAIYCGYSIDCGLACQLHHRIACMILSYSFNIPMIHNDKHKWPYGEPWEKYFKKLGSKCTTSSVAKIIDLDWNQIKCDARFNICLKEGIPMPREFVRILSQNHENPFLWLIGQFSKFVFQPNDEAVDRIEEFKKSLAISPQDLNGSPLIGMHVRRTDKYGETKAKLNATVFMNAAIAFRNENFIDPEQQITIFIASEDKDVITEFRSNYESPSWKFVTDGSNNTCATKASRKTELFQIIRDIQVLVDSDYVICTYSSNICRLVLELRSKNAQHKNPESHVKSLDGKYSFQLLNKNPLNNIIADRINPI